MADKPMSNTMEINSILEEARKRNQGLSAPKKPAPRQSAPQQAPRASAPAPTGRSGDGYVDISGGGYYGDAAKEPAKKKKSKKPLVITLVVILILALAGVGGYTWYAYENSGSSTIVADKVSVNGVDIGGKTMDEAKAAMSNIETSLADGIKVHVTADGKEYDLTKKDFTYSFNTDSVLDQIKKHSEEKGFNKEEKDYEIVMTVDTSNAKSLADKIAKDIHADPTNAKVTKFDSSADDMFTIQKEVTGKDVDTDDLVNKIDGVFTNGNTSGNVEATVNSTNPKLTESYLRKNIVKLSEFSTYSTNNSNGNENMRVSLAACNNSIIEPGETWSFNDCTGDSNKESNGYKPAGVIVQGRSETGVGGGICQSSTTIYNAGILCGMEVVERACHYYKSTYVDAGRDATIDYGNIDLKLKNRSKCQLFMKCWMDGAELHCEMYGIQSPKFDEVKISTSDPEYFSNGYTVKAWRTYYKNGKEVGEDSLPKSTYYTSAPSSGGSSSSSSSNNNANYADDDSGSADSGDADSGNADSGDAGDAGNVLADAGDAGDAGGDAGSDEVVVADE